MGESEEKKSPGTRTGISTVTLLILIVLLSVVIRMWGLDFGLPQQFHPDEPVVVSRAQYGVATGDWNPRAFHWPSFQIYILGFEYGIWYQAGKLTGAWESDELVDIPTGDRFIAYALRAPSGFYYLGRLTTVLFCAGIVWLMFIFSRRLLSVPWALAASALIAFHPIMIRHSRFITPDIPAEFFFLAALFFMDRLYLELCKSRGSTAIEKKFKGIVWSGIFAAIMIGLGTGTKYPVAVLSIPLGLIILLAPSGMGISGRIIFIFRLAATVIITFLITTPFALIDYEQFLRDIMTIGWHVQTGHIGMEARGGIWMASIARLIRDSGWVWTTVGLIGLIGFFTGLRRKWHLLLAFLFILIGLAPLTVFSDRYLVPLIPFFVLGISWLFERLSVHTILNKPRMIMVGAVVVFFMVSVYGFKVISNDARVLTMTDTRELALEWVEDNIPAHSVIVEEQGGPNLNTSLLVPLVPEPWYVIVEITPLFARGGPVLDPLDTLIQVQPDWVIISSNTRDRYMRESAAGEFPELVAVFMEYYRLVDNYLIEEARFVPEDNKITGPEIVIYRVPGDLWDRVLLETSTVGSVLNRESEGE